MLRSKMGGARPTAVRIMDHLFLPSERAVKLSDLQIERGTKLAVELLFPGKPGTGVTRPFKGTPFASKMAAVEESDAARVRAGVADLVATERSAGGLVSGAVPSKSSSFHDDRGATPKIAIPVAPSSPSIGAPEKELVLGLSLTPMVMDDPVTGIWTIIQRAASQAGHSLQKSPAASVRCAGKRIPLPSATSPHASMTLRQLGLVPGAAQIVVTV
ncbi:hypothetical protein FNF29_05941 [Cafeteria roenbergensis]|uniref:Uncharacterized protein n=1 Tax=Cafeteria roenbergensis TaxID=33653 RepID=A0A5A8C9I3_CAFRO|nr:hypothetical protein FNF29_05941 [Cafeteria roenbergensis]|eukprot:KAA0149555.1 hypothetical protein FNF29_05941 [Cafeteria roenbergensis]